MQDLKTQLRWRGKQSFAVALSMAWLCALGASTATAQSGDSTLGTAPAARLLTVEEGWSIVDAARTLKQTEVETQDCSHVVHQIYQNAGFEYPYASSFEIYAGNVNFVRVRSPRAGDLIVWPGHVGIVVDAVQHGFYSLVSTGLETQDYEAPYWKSRGTPHFYRFNAGNEGVLTAAKTSPSPQVPSAKTQPSDDYAPNRPPKASAKPTAVIDGPLAPSELADPAPPFEIPSSIVIAARNSPPTREEVFAGISELNDAVGNVLRTDDSSRYELPITVVEQFKVERVETKRDHGWAHLEIDSIGTIDHGIPRLKQRREKVRCELRRKASGWEALTPADRIYVPRDVAVKNLAAQLARLTESDDGTARQAALRRESRLANMLSALLEPAAISPRSAASKP